MKKILSVVVPTYNVEKYLDRCLLSLVFDKSILDKLEIIIVNDGSKDNSIEIAKEYEQKYPNTVVIVDKENGGHGSTINAGLGVATGEYYKVLDSDDWVNVDDFGKFVKKLEKVDTDIVLTNYTRELAFDGVAERFKYKHLDYGKVYSLDKDDLEMFDEDYMFMHTITMKTELLRQSKLKLSEHTFYVDMEFILLPLTHLNTFVYLDFDIYRYWIGRPDQSMNITNMFKNRSHHERVLRRLINFYTTSGLSSNKQKYIFKILTLMLGTHYVIYSNQKLSSQETKEIKAFDAWLKKTDGKLYKSASNRFPFIEYYRRTNFIFSSYLHTKFKQVSFLLSENKIQSSQKGAK